MKKRVSLLVVLLALVIVGFTMNAMNVEAAEIIDRGYCGGEGDGTNLTWTLDRDGVLVIEGQGEMKDWTWEELYDNPSDPQRINWHRYFDPDMRINDVINSVIVKDGVKNIGNYAFHYCESLSSIDLPESIMRIGDDAFSCCESLGGIVIPESLTSIGDWAFAWCSNLSSINLPESLTSIGDSAFTYCESLGSIVIPESVTSIGEGAFDGCSNLSSINLPESLTSIGGGAFSWCSNLSSIKLSESITNIGDYAFWGCENLSSIVIPKSITSIGDGLFGYCFNLSRIDLPESVTSIGYLAFHSCSNLSSITLPEKLTSIGNAAFEDCYKLSNIVLPESLTSIGDGAFKYCFNLGSIYIPASVDAIYRNIFAYAKLKDIYYGGTWKKWRDINIDRWYSEDTGYDALLYATIHYAGDNYNNKKLKDFVSHLYRNFLKREPDERGLDDWVDVLRFGKATGAKVVSGFVLSPEYQANSLSNQEYVTALYRTIFDREPDAAGLNAWVAVMENGYSNKKVLAGFVNSDEFENLCIDLGIARGTYKSDEAVDKSNKISTFVARLYKICLGRTYDYNGLDNWVRALTYGTASVYSVVKEFFNSQEFENRELDDAEFVTVAYQTILDREPDVSGLKSWTDALARGYTRNRILDGFLKSTEFGNLCAEYGIKR